MRFFYVHLLPMKLKKGIGLKYKLFILLYLFVTPLSMSSFVNPIEPKANVWDVLTNEFSLNHEVNHPEVQKHIKWIVKHPEYLKKMANQAKPYIYHILNEIRKRNLPGEIALIPMIESEYDPFSSSNAGAAGLWQIMPHTGVELGLTKNWWVDGRRSIGPSTNAALNYLTYLHHFFHGNWILAFAAYDSGEGTVSRAVKHSKKRQFWSLSLPHETKAYIPKLLALSEIIKNPKRYHVELPEIPHKPYFKEVDINAKLDLNHAAKLAEVPSYDIHRLNPGFKDWSSHPSQPYKLLIPAEHVNNFYRNLANIPKEPLKKESTRVIPEHKNTVELQKYTVKKGDTLKRIARKHHIKLSILKKANPQLKKHRLKPGKQIFLAER